MKVASAWLASLMHSWCDSLLTGMYGPPTTTLCSDGRVVKLLIECSRPALKYDAKILDVLYQL